MGSCDGIIIGRLLEDGDSRACRVCDLTNYQFASIAYESHRAHRVIDGATFTSNMKASCLVANS